MLKSVKKVLIAHQCTIPHYRVPFYEAVERLRPRWWEFCVVYDVEKARDRSFLKIEDGSLGFPTKDCYAYTLKLGGKQICFQSFLFNGAAYDFLVMGGELNNISYPLCYLWRYRGKRVAYWGHGRDVSVVNAQGIKALAEQTKIWLTRRADCFFAYTNGVRDYMVRKGVDQNKIFVLHNTIDIMKQRNIFETLIPERKNLRSQLGLSGKKVLLFVGRLNRQKQLDVLLDSFCCLRARDNSYHLVIIGAGDGSMFSKLKDTCGEGSFRYLGVVPDDDIGRFYVASDLYVFPGAVGLGPLQALCFDLTSAVINSPVHSPEYEYLNHDNALILPEGSTAERYASAIITLLEDRDRWAELRAHAWPSIRHLTIDHMAQNFISGVNSILRN
jgi:glycosyltransferase involved in cell wall biosynthesis